MHTNGFSFTLPNGPNNFTLLVEACTNLVTGTWEPVATNTLTYKPAPFTDSNATNHLSCYYRLTKP